MTIERVMNDENGEVQYVLLNLDDGEMMQRSKVKPKSHWEFLKQILEAIITSPDHSITETQALGLIFKIPRELPKHPSSETAEQLLSEWIEGHILVKNEGEVTLGFVGVAEFRQIIMSRLPEAHCSVCKETCLAGTSCPHCSKAMHKTCYGRLRSGPGTSVGVKCHGCNNVF